MISKFFEWLEPTLYRNFKKKHIDTIFNIILTITFVFFILCAWLSQAVFPTGAANFVLTLVWLAISSFLICLAVFVYRVNESYKLHSSKYKTKSIKSLDELTKGEKVVYKYWVYTFEGTFKSPLSGIEYVKLSYDNRGKKEARTREVKEFLHKFTKF